ncbi:MAG TPA: PP2C family serine/threonine-protein phosphatase [Longimicrobiales bacterium]
MKFDAHGATDVGRQRSRNEDSYLVSRERLLYAVADGMGGHAAGDVASRTAIETVDRLVGPVAAMDVAARTSQLVEATRAANGAILDDAQREPERAGMGTTLSILSVLPTGDTYLIAHVGDSRIYQLRDDVLTQLTVDHTWVQQQVELGRLSPRRARVHPYASVLTHALGVPEEERIDTRMGTVRPGDIYLLCSDGLTTVLEDLTIGEILSGGGSLEAIADELIAEANDEGGPDNITVVLVRATD